MLTLEYHYTDSRIDEFPVLLIVKHDITSSVTWKDLKQGKLFLGTPSLIDLPTVFSAQLRDDILYRLLFPCKNHINSNN
jgi:hypothetical protein